MNKKVVLVTGSSIGLGASIIEKFAKNNYNVIINYNTHEKEAIDLKEKLEKQYNTNCLVIKCDISNEEEIKYLFDKSIKEFKNIDVLVNNASISNDSIVDDKTKNSFMKILETNLVGTFLVTRIFANKMYENKKGTIINIGSTNAIDTYYEYSLDYDASKAGIINLTHNLANHYSPYLRVNCVCPGWINTPMNKDMDKSFKEKEEEKILLNRFAEANEIASLVYFLSTNEASYINDSIIRIDGGKKNE